MPNHRQWRMRLTRYPEILVLVLTFCSLPYAGASSKQKTKEACHSPLSACPAWGCAGKDSPDGVENVLKHHRPKTDNTTRLTVADFIGLQCQTDARFGIKTNCSETGIGPQEC